MVAFPALTAVTLPSATVATVSSEDFQLTALFVAFSGATVAESVSDAPSTRLRVFLSRDTPVTAIVFAVTVTSQVAVLLPSAVVTEMVAFPALPAVTLPSATVATLSSDDFQLTALLVALSGATVAVSVSDSPSTRLRVFLFRVTPVTATVLAVTVTEQVAVLLPSAVVTVMVVFPALTAVTLPSATVATLSSDDFQLTALLVALSGATVAVRVSDAPSRRLSVVLLSETPVTAILVGFGCSVGPQPASRITMVATSPIAGSIRLLSVVFMVGKLLLGF